MIEISSYLRDPAGRFVPVGDADFVPAEPRYIEGAIDLVINHVAVLDQSLWDYVDQLWAYIANMLSDLPANDTVSTYFPDQPIEFTIARSGGGRVRVSSVAGEKKRETTVAERELVAALRSAGLDFFADLSAIVPGNAGGYQDAINRLSRAGS